MADDKSDRSPFALIGLGNPGSKYANTRHNVGFWVLDEFVRRRPLGECSWSEKFCCEFCRSEIASRQLILIKPQKYMNRSGEAAGPLLRYFKIEPQNTIVVYDDLDLGVGALRIALGGSAAGHRGVSDLITHLGTEKFLRVRLGIGRPLPGTMTPADWVLSRVGQEDRDTLEETTKLAADSISVLVEQGVEVAQREFNRKESNSKSLDIKPK